VPNNHYSKAVLKNEEKNKLAQIQGLKKVFEHALGYYYNYFFFNNVERKKTIFREAQFCVDGNS